MIIPPKENNYNLRETLHTQSAYFVDTFQHKCLELFHQKFDLILFTTDCANYRVTDFILYIS